MKTRTAELAGEGFDAFALISETIADPTRLAAERQAREAAAAELERRQTGFDFGPTD